MQIITNDCGICFYGNHFLFIEHHTAMAAPVKDSLLMNENDLKSTLMNQKLRAEQHRSNYETLKAQHILLQKVNT